MLAGRRKIIVVAAAAVAVLLSLPTAARLFVNTAYFRGTVEQRLQQAVNALPATFTFDVASVDLGGRIVLARTTALADGRTAFSLEWCTLTGAAARFFLGRRDYGLACERGFVDLEHLGKMKPARNGGAAAGGSFTTAVKKLELRFGLLKHEFAFNAVGGRDGSTVRFADPALIDLTVRNIDRAAGTAEVEVAGARVRGVLDIFSPRLKDHLDGTVSGKVKVTASRSEITLSTDGLTVEGAEIDHPIVSHVPLRFPQVRVAGMVSYSLVTGLVRLEGARVEAGGVAATVNGRFMKGGYDLSASAEDVRPNAVVAALGGDEFKDFDLDGAVDVGVKARGNLKEEKKLSSIEISGAVRDLKQRSRRLDYLKGPFTYGFEDGRGEPARVTIGEANPSYVPIGAIPRHVWGAVVVAEDAGYFGHKGIEFKEIQSAVEDNLTSDKPYLRGGSTITQQVVKNLFLTREKHLVRKVKEAILAVELTAALSKERVLDIYLNGIEWGPGIFGIGSASQMYFGKTVDALAPHEAAYLASIIPNPRVYYSYFVKNEIKDDWYTRLDDLISRMNQFGYLDDEQYYNAMGQRIVFDRFRPDAPPLPQASFPATDSAP